MLRIAFQEAFDRLSCLLSSIHQLFFFHNFHVSLKFCSSACNKLFMVNVSNYHMFFLFFFGNARCCALRLLILECNKWDDLLLIRMTEKTMHSRLEEVFIFGCSALLCHLGNFLFWAARGSVAPTPRRVAFQATVVCRAQKKKGKKSHTLGNRKGCHSRAHTLAVSVSIPSM